MTQTEWHPRYDVPQPIAPGLTNGLAVASLVLGIVWLAGLGSLLAVIFGHVGRNQMRRGGYAKGNGLAIAGLVLGYIGLAFTVLTVVGGGDVNFNVHA